MKRNSLGFTPVVLLGVGAVLLVLAGVLFYWQTNKVSNSLGIQDTLNSEISTPTAFPSPTIDPTIDWKTYVNRKYSFSFKYPPTIYLAPNATEDNIYFPLSGAVYIQEQAMHVTIEKNTNHLSSSDWLNSPEVKNTYFTHSDKAPDLINMDILGQDWLTTNDPAGIAGLAPNINFKWITFYNGKVILISNEAGIDGNSLKLILSSFKFQD